jgi:hypothetical protein
MVERFSGSLMMGSREEHFDVITSKHHSDMETDYQAEVSQSAPAKDLNS